MNDQEIIQLIKEDDKLTFSKIYTNYHDEFLRFAKKRDWQGFVREDAEDAYNDSMTALYRNIKSGRLTKLTATLKTYIFQIGIYKLIDKYNQKQKESGGEIIENIADVDISGIDIFEEDDDEQAKISLILSDTIALMTDSCKTMLTLYWYQKKCDKEIVELTDFSTPDSVKSKRSGCMKALKKEFLTRLVNEKLLTSAKRASLLR